jgi:hypothetical protein
MDLTKVMTRHALQRSISRQIPATAIEATLTYGRMRRARSAEIFTLGWREIRDWAARGVDLSGFEGVQVVCTHSGRVLTVYRNRRPASARGRAAPRRPGHEEPFENGIRQVP